MKYGAAPSGKNHQRYRPRLNAFLRRDPEPELSWDKGRLFGQEPNHPTQDMFMGGVGSQSVTGDIELAHEEEGLWVEQDGRKDDRRMIMDDFGPVGSEHGGSKAEHDNDSDMEMPFPRRQSAKLAGISEAPAEDAEPSEPRRKKLRQDNFLGNMFADHDPADSVTAVNAPTTGPMMMHFDSGSYAYQLEQELAEAKQTIQGQETKIAELESACAGAQEENQRLCHEVETLKGLADDPNVVEQ